MKTRLTLLIFIIVQAGCGFYKAKPQTTVLPDFSSLGYQDVRTYLLAPYCLSCHGSGRTPSFNSYADVMANLNYIQADVLGDMTMPPSRSPQPNGDVRALLQAWINEGAPEYPQTPAREPSPSTTPTTTPLPTVTPAPTPELPVLRPVSFTELKDRVLTPNCNGCHAVGNKKGRVEFETYKSFTSVLDKVQFVINGKPLEVPDPKLGVMPPKKAKQLTPLQKEMINDWFEDGQLEN